MNQGPHITKGTKVTARWLQAKLVALSGMQMKTGATEHVVTGVCRHFRGNDPVNPTEVKVFIDPEGDVSPDLKRVRPHGCSCPEPHIEINPDHIIKVHP